MRKAKPKRRILLPDPRFHDVEVTRFVNNLMHDGKKSVAFSIFYDAIDRVGERMKEEGMTPLDVWRKALENVRPERKVSLAMKNLIQYARKRNGQRMSEKLAAEILAAYNSEGGAFRRKEDIHKMAEANKAFAHFRF